MIQMPAKKKAREYDQNSPGGHQCDTKTVDSSHQKTLTKMIVSHGNPGTIVGHTTEAEPHLDFISFPISNFDKPDLKKCNTKKFGIETKLTVQKSKNERALDLKQKNQTNGNQMRMRIKPKQNTKQTHKSDKQKLTSLQV